MNILGDHRGYKKLVSLNYGMFQVKLLQNVINCSVKREQNKIDIDSFKECQLYTINTKVDRVAGYFYGYNTTCNCEGLKVLH